MRYICNGCEGEVTRSEERVWGEPFEAIKGVVQQSSWVVSTTYECVAKCVNFTAGPVGHIGFRVA